MQHQSPTIGEHGKRKWLYPDRRPGIWASRRKYLAWILILFYLSAPFVTLNSLPLIRIDLKAATVFLFGFVFHFNETFYLVFLLISLALLLFYITSIKGRIWCGFACPQTVFIDWVYRPIEELIEGSAFRRKKLDQNPNNLYLFKKIVKHLIFIVISAIIANAFLAYFIAPSTLWRWISSSPFNNLIAFGIMFFVLAATYFDFAWFREQFCTFLCPYARFQSVMMDDKTPAVAYDYNRGDPRGKRAKGDCIDCKLCVRVCPTGIDIRDGLQLECVQCYRCVDACDSIMKSLGRPTELIRSASHYELQKNQTNNKVRLRPIFYLTGLIFMVSMLVILATKRSSISINFLKNNKAVYSKLADGRVMNTYTLIAINRLSEPQSIGISLVSPNNAEIICGACDETLKPFEHKSIPLMIILPTDNLSCTQKITLNSNNLKKDFKLSFNYKDCE